MSHVYRESLHDWLYSVTGEPVNLREATDEALAAVIDGFTAEMDVLKERRRIVTRELAKRMGDRTDMRAGDWSLRLDPYIYVRRASDV